MGVLLPIWGEIGEIRTKRQGSRGKIGKIADRLSVSRMGATGKEATCRDRRRHVDDHRGLGVRKPHYWPEGVVSGDGPQLAVTALKIDVGLLLVETPSPRQNPIFSPPSVKKVGSFRKSTTAQKAPTILSIISRAMMARTITSGMISIRRMPSASSSKPKLVSVAQPQSNPSPPTGAARQRPQDAVC